MKKSQGEFCSRELRKNGREFRTVGGSENPGVPALFGGHNLLPLVEGGSRPGIGNIVDATIAINPETMQEM